LPRPVQIFRKTVLQTVSTAKSFYESAIEIFCKTVLQTVSTAKSAAKRFEKSFYEKEKK